MPDLPFFTNESQPFLFGRKWVCFTSLSPSFPFPFLFLFSVMLDINIVMQKDDEKAREFEKWFVLNKPTYVPT